MVGGQVIEVCDHPEDRNRIYVNVADRPYKRLKECAIYVERNEDSERIQIGDSLWWQGRSAFWTPQDNRVSDEEADGRGFRCGVDYDIQIPRVGYSGVNYPVGSVSCFARSIFDGD